MGMHNEIAILKTVCKFLIRWYTHIPHYAEDYSYVFT